MLLDKDGGEPPKIEIKVSHTVRIIDEREEESNKKTKVSLTEDELAVILQLIDNSILERSCNENELGYMGLLNLKNKLQK